MARKWHWKKEMKNEFKKVFRKGIVIGYDDIEEDDCFYTLTMKNRGYVILDKRYNIVE